MSEHSRDDTQSWRRWQMEDLQDQPLAQGEQQARQARIRRQAMKRQAELEAERRQAREAARAEGHAEGLEQGRQTGYAEGLEEGRRAGEAELQRRADQALAPLLGLAQQFGQGLERLDEDIADALVHLALATGRQLAGEALDARPEQILTLLRELLHVEPALTGQPRLWLHPDDLALVDDRLGEEFTAAGWSLQPDDQLSRGGCRVTSQSGELDASWESRCQAVMAQVRQRHARHDASDDDQADGP
ncbi:flagellar assembly protein FliH [Halomonas sp. YLGW01]|uniref:flagellar assembly protein FliH n=1 Tax=Halomonas sp. YLGW01 TaxID=2773308 RepID=UPI00177E0387|nr:flagellar assembly protein FliH [Halomonas sp. YLGW01]